MTLLAVQPYTVMIGARAQAAVADTYRQLNLFGDVFERVRADYVEKPNDAKLIETAINGMLAGLDPHSSYMDAKSFKDMQVQTRGEFGGLGIEVTMEDGLIKVVAPIDDTPAAKAGVMAAPAAAPRRMSEVLRIIREPVRLRQPPTMGLDQRESRLFETRYRAPVGWSLSLGLRRYGSQLP